MKVIEVSPRGFCVGVINALKSLNVAKDKSIPQPIYILGNIVHNKYISKALKN